MISSDIFKYSPLLCIVKCSLASNVLPDIGISSVYNLSSIFLLFVRIYHIRQVLNPLLEELLLGNECIIFFYIQTCYLATSLSELLSSCYFFWKPERTGKLISLLSFCKNLSPLAASHCCCYCFIIRVINVSN